MMNVLRKPLKGRVATPVSLSASIADTPIDIEHMSSMSIAIQVTDTGALAGAFKLQVSNNAFVDNVGDTSLFDPIRSDVFWEDLDSSEQTFVPGTLTYSWDIDFLSTEAIRLVWTRSAGTGSALIYYCAKGPGGGV